MFFYVVLGYVVFFCCVFVVFVDDVEVVVECFLVGFYDGDGNIDVEEVYGDVVVYGVGVDDVC